MQRKAICFPSCDHRGRAAYPFRVVIFFGLEPSALTIQSWRCSFSPALENTASVLESGDQAGSKSVLSPEVGILNIAARAFPDVPLMQVFVDVSTAILWHPSATA